MPLYTAFTTEYHKDGREILWRPYPSSPCPGPCVVVQDRMHTLDVRLAFLDARVVRPEREFVGGVRPEHMSYRELARTPLSQRSIAAMLVNPLISEIGRVQIHARARKILVTDAMHLIKQPPADTLTLVVRMHRNCGQRVVRLWKRFAQSYRTHHAGHPTQSDGLHERQTRCNPAQPEHSAAKPRRAWINAQDSSSDHLVIQMSYQYVIAVLEQPSSLKKCGPVSRPPCRAATQVEEIRVRPLCTERPDHYGRERGQARACCRYDTHGITHSSTLPLTDARPS